MCTLEAYVHRMLTGKRVLGIGDAAGMFPVDSEKKDYNQEMVEKFDKLVESYGFPWKLRDIMPEVMVAGQDAGTAHRKCIRRYFCICDDRPGKSTFQTIQRD